MKQRILWAVLLSMTALIAAEFKVNNRIPATGFTDGNTSWKYEKKVSFANEIPAEFLITKKQIKTHKKFAYIKGFNGDLILQIKAPGKINEIEWSASIKNFADKQKRNISLS